MKAELTQIAASVEIGRRGTDQASISKRIARVFGTKQAAKYFFWELKPLTSAEQKALMASQKNAATAPPRGARKPTHRFEWSFNESLLKDDEQYDGYAAMVTTVPMSEMSCDAIFSRYELQNLAEQANHPLKGPLAVRPGFLHSPNASGVAGVSDDDRSDDLFSSTAHLPPEHAAGCTGEGTADDD